MTLAASKTWDVRGVDGPDYKVGPGCSNPTCTRFADYPHLIHDQSVEQHHIWRRSQLGGDYRWVIIEGKLVANLTGLCRDCHDAVTGGVGGHRNAIRYDTETGVFNWCDVVVETGGELSFPVVGPLNPQPPAPGTLAARAPGHAHESGACPFCGQTRRRSSARSPGDRRRRKTWTVPVPAEERENGAEVLDALVEDLGPLLGYGTDAGARYYVLVPVLYYAQHNRRAFVEALSGVGA